MFEEITENTRDLNFSDYLKKSENHHKEKGLLKNIKRSLRSKILRRNFKRKTFLNLNFLIYYSLFLLLIENSVLYVTEYI